MAKRGRRRYEWRDAAVSGAVAFALLLMSIPAYSLSAWPGDGEPASACVRETDAMASMPQGRVRFGEQRDLTVRIAATAEHRAAGMQYLCPDAIADNPILFVFDSPARPGFHMRNVHGGLDIIFIGTNRTITAIEQMVPEQPHLTRPGEPVVAALEMAAGEAEALDLAKGQNIEWDY